jgi:hypothetical protein
MAQTRATIREKEFGAKVITEDRVTFYGKTNWQHLAAYPSGTNVDFRANSDVQLSLSEIVAIMKSDKAFAVHLSPLVSTVSACPKFLVNGDAANIRHYFALIFSAMNTDRSTFRACNSGTRRFLWRSFLRVFWQTGSNLRTSKS